MAAKVAVLVNGAPLDGDTIAALGSVTVELNTDEPSTASLTFALNKSSTGAWSLVDDGTFTPFAELEVHLGFGGGAGALGSALGGLFGGGSAGDGLTPVFAGYVVDVAAKFGDEAASATLSVSAGDACVLLASEEKVASWPDQADSDIVQAIVGGYGLAVTAQATATVHAAATTTIVQRGSDLAFVRRLARRNGYEFYVAPDDSGTPTAYFQPPQLDGTPQQTLALQFGDDSNLRTFSTKLTGRKPLAVKTAQLDVDSGSVNAATVTDSDYTLLGATDAGTLVGDPLGGLVTPSENLAEMRVLGPPSADAGELQALAQAVRDEASWVLSASGEINAEAYGSVLLPHRTVLVKGAGKAYSGTYYVVRVVHELAGDGRWTQRFEALRNARDATGDENFAGPAGGLALAGLP